MEQRYQRNSQGFTLIELLVVIALLGILSSGAVGAFQHITHTAKISSLDQSLATVSTMTEANVLLENMSYGDAAKAAIDEAMERGSVELTIFTNTEASLIIQARLASQDEPCRQLDIHAGSPTDCVGTVDPVVPAPPAVAETTVAPSPETKPEGTKPDEKSDPAEEDASPKEEQVSPAFSFKLEGLKSEVTWWKRTGDSDAGEGRWRADMAFSNESDKDQYLDLTITIHDSEGGSKPWREPKPFYVPAKGSSTFSVRDNSIGLDAKGRKFGIRAVTVSVTRVVTPDEKLDEMQTKVDPKAEGSSATVKWPEKFR